jgi:hypothetical protein
MPLVVPGVARFAINQVMGGRNVVNVLDYFIDTTGSTMSREDAVAGQAGSIVEQWSAEVQNQQTEDISAVSVSYVDLDEADGVTGSVVSGGAYTWPRAGQNTGPALPANTSVLVTKQAPSARGRRNGRMFITGFRETDTDESNPNRLSATAVGFWQSDMDSFLENTNELDGLGTAFSSNMVVVHITSRDSSGNPLTGDSSVVQALAVDDVVATQRRRLRG